MLLISSNEVSGEHEVAPRLIQDLLGNFSRRCWPKSPRDIDILRNSEKNRRTRLPNWVQRRPLRQRFAEIFGNFKFLAFHCHRSNVKKKKRVNHVRLCRGRSCPTYGISWELGTTIHGQWWAPWHAPLYHKGTLPWAGVAVVPLHFIDRLHALPWH